MTWPDPTPEVQVQFLRNIHFYMDIEIAPTSTTQMSDAKTFKRHNCPTLDSGFNFNFLIAIKRWNCHLATKYCCCHWHRD